MTILDPRRGARSIPYTIGIDPGVTTGVAVVNDYGDHHALTTVDLTVLDALLHALREKYRPVTVVVEKGPTWGSNYRGAVERAEAVIQGVFSDVEWVGPGTWKGHPKSKTADLPRGTSIHARDACGLARWFVLTRR